MLDANIKFITCCFDNYSHVMALGVFVKIFIEREGNLYRFRYKPYPSRYSAGCGMRNEVALGGH